MMSEEDFWEREVGLSLDRIRRQTENAGLECREAVASIPVSGIRRNRILPPILLRVAALLVAAVGLVLFSLSQAGGSGMDATAFVMNHKTDTAALGSDPELMTGDLEEAKSWLAGHLPQVSCPPEPPVGYRLTEARIVRVEEELAGMLVYEKEGQKISCFLQSGRKSVDHGFEQVERRADGIQVGRCRNYQVVTWTGEEGSGVVVGDLGETVLLAFAEQSMSSPAL